MVSQEILSRLQQARIPKTKKEYKGPPPMSEKKKVQVKQDKKAGVNLDLAAWFEYHMTHSEPVCAECGMRADWLLELQYAEIWKACQAHIMPKKKGAFPSLRAVLENHIVLFPSWGGHLCGCHGFYDSNWYNASTMKIWPHVEQVFVNKLYRLIPKEEHKRIPEPLIKLIGE